MTCKLLNPYGRDQKMTQHKWFTGNYRRIVWVCFTILFDQLLKLGQVLLLKKIKRNNFVISGGVIFEIFVN